MKRNLVFKLSACFLILSIIVLGLLNTVGIHLIQSYIVDTKKKSLYEHATLISNQYFDGNYTSESTLSDYTFKLKAISQPIQARILIVDNNGKILCDTTSSKESLIGKSLFSFMPTLLSHDFLYNSTMNGLLREDNLCCIYPLPYNYKSRSYIIAMLPYDVIHNEVLSFQNILTIFSLSFLGIIVLLFTYLYLMIARPLRIIRNAAMEYGRGNFTYEIKLHGNDEFQDVATSLNYMSGELSRQDEYQKKFIANISHDFRSPLTSIKGYVEAILDGTIPVENQKKYLDIIVFETERLNKLTSNLLELNRFDSNQNILDITRFDINSVLKRTCASFEGLCLKKKIQFNLVFSNKELYVDADASKIQQVLYNLIDNAIKFSHMNAIIKISTFIKSDKAFISIKDYGVGIPKASIPKIWERFYKTDTSRGKDKKGTGLGLSITKEIIQAHKEHIDVISTEGAGSEFTFSLPLSNTEQSAHPLEGFI